MGYNYAYDNGWDMFEKDLRSGDFRPESAGEDFDPEGASTWTNTRSIAVSFSLTR